VTAVACAPMDNPTAPASFPNTLIETLEMRAVELTADCTVFEMPVRPRVHQPMGTVHGGATAALAETAASIGAFLNCDDSHFAVGVELSISHLRPRESGTLRARAIPVRRGRTIHVWTIDVDDQNGERVAVARCTLAIRPKGNAPS
jgi:1,4-dihydroxy-2-naphthoyl-CoA hydrolase